MAGTDPYDSGPVITLDAEVRKAVARLRTLLVVNPKECHLFVLDHECWLSDRYVMVKVTDDPAVAWPYKPDGMYRLTAGKGLVEEDGIMPPDTAALIRSVRARGRKHGWTRMERTDWSMADSEAKLMLAYTLGARGRHALAVNEGVWNAFTEAFPPTVTFEYSPDCPYRVCSGGEEVGYIASAHFTDANQVAAQKMVGVL